jgi:hypothetical protein
VSRDEAKNVLLHAMRLWEDSARRSLFVYDEETGVPVDFVFDGRQECLNESREERGEYLRRYKVVEGEDRRLEAERRVIDGLQASWTKRLGSYNERAGALNRVLSSVNSGHGGDPVAIAAEKRDLDAELSRIEEERERLRSRIAAFNVRIQNLNVSRRQLNSAIADYNDRFTEMFAFHDVARYKIERGKASIELYEYHGPDSAALVLGHELGHALGLGHAVESGSLMNQAMTEENQGLTAPSTGDLARLTALCGAP